MRRLPHWLAVIGSIGLLLAWGGLAFLLLGAGLEAGEAGEDARAAAVLAQATLVGAGLALGCGLLHPQRKWTFGLVLGGGVFLGLFALP